MKIAIIHHHLHPGGVTSVICQQIRAIAGWGVSVKIQLMLGEAPAELALPGVEIMVNPLLKYQDCSGMKPDAVRRQAALLTEYLSANTGHDAIITAHNLSLGKNPLLNIAIRALAEQGRKILYYCHDFAEDRPENLRNLQYAVENCMQQTVQSALYPAMPTCRYAALTSHDARRLQYCGIAAEQITRLPNPVTLPPETPAAPAATPAQVMRALGLAPELRSFLYPVRGIRRKNLGEFILLAAVFGDCSNWITTLPPKNPVEKTEYDCWLEFCRKQGINVCFGAGEHFDLKSLMNAADACFTTSVMEGFGMAFLEPWLFDRPVMGRELYVCADFRESGIDFPLLYPAIQIESNDGALRDFAGLDTPGKMTFIADMLKDPSAFEQFRQLNPMLEKISLPVDVRLIARNKQIVENEYSLENYGARLYEIYQAFL